MQRTGLPGVRWCGMGLAALLAGCTMCPDPYDYSGPVPNGSPPQNDFRARSNGILPLGSAPAPWPPLVRAAGRRGYAGPTPTIPATDEAPAIETAAAPPPDGEVEDGPAVDGESADGADTATVDVVAAAQVVAEEFELADESVAAEAAGLQEEVAVPGGEPAGTVGDVGAVPAVHPAVAETPGWRALRRR